MVVAVLNLTDFSQFKILIYFNTELDLDGGVDATKCMRCDTDIV